VTHWAGEEVAEVNARAAAVIAEDDHDLYRWVSGGAPAPEVHTAIVALIRRYHGAG
jgi:succinate dehydrogenase flavin-adding protein (antitoxin of CptAB toxin-antitoxin module)